MSLASMITLIEAAGLLIGFLLAFRAGRSLARRKHDADLVRRHGRRLPGGIGLVFYLLVLASLLVNLATILTMQAVSAAAKLLLGVATGHVVGVLGGLAVTAAGIIGGYLFYSHRYRGIEEPLTREGRLALRGVELGGRAVEGAGRLKEGLRRGAESLGRRLPRGPLGGAEQAGSRGKGGGEEDWREKWR